MFFFPDLSLIILFLFMFFGTLLGVSRSISDTPPNHYTMKIQNFSQLAKNKIEPYHSNDFEAGGYKWYENYV